MIRRHRLVGDQIESQDDAEVRRPEGEERLWYRVLDPQPAEIERLREVFGLTELALDAICDPSHPTEVEDCGDHLFILLVMPVERERGLYAKLAVFLGPDWLISVQTVRVSPTDEVEARVLHEPSRFLAVPERVMHALADHMVDGFANRVDGIVERAEAIENDVIAATGRDGMRDILGQRRTLSALLRVVRHQRDVLLSLSRTNHPVLSHRITPYLRDAYDHCLRVQESLESAKETLAAVRDAHLALVNNRLSETMRVLTVIATIMMPLSLVAGVFGMNFDPMPLLQTGYGFWVSIALMGGIAAGMLTWFRRRGWL